MKTLKYVLYLSGRVEPQFLSRDEKPENSLKIIPGYYGFRKAEEILSKFYKESK